MSSTPLESSAVSRADRESLVSRVIAEMSSCWRKGQRPRAEDFLDRHQDLWNLPSAVMDLLYEELCLRHDQGETLEPEEIIQRFPQWQQQIEILLSCIHTMQNPAAFPRAGKVIGDFQLLSELGCGGQGRVFLATQTSLAARPVVLKITPCKGDEHLSLARLQHTHIVPLLSVLDEPGRNLRVLCMPYFGGLTLAEILEALQDRPPGQRTGRQILQVLDAARAGAAVALPPGRDPATPFLEQASYVLAIAWIGACLAEALRYAHDRGLLHLDLKPANVLVTANRQPMLLDFHLAHEPLKPGDAGANFGGTRAYMSPEQTKAMAAIKAGRSVPETIDGRSDIYSLGLVLYEALALKKESGITTNPVLPVVPRGKSKSRTLVPLHRCNPEVPVGLSDIVAKCLSPRAKMRYQTASALATDLWAHLNNSPLQGVANRSIAERWRKWRRRKPHLLSLVGMLAVVLAVSGVALALAVVHRNHRVDEARAALADGHRLLTKGQHADAANTLKRGLSQLAHVPGNQDLRKKLRDRLHQASRGQMAQELHEITDRFRLLYGADSFPVARLETLQASCREFWEKREQILARLGKELEAEIEQRVQLDLLDLAILGTDLRVRLAGESQVAAARQEALQVLAQAEALFGPHAVLYHERRLHAEAIGQQDLALEAQKRALAHPPRTVWEHYALGRSLMNAGQLEAAAAHFERATAIQPTGLWPNFYQGICCYRLGRFEDSALAFTACTTLAPHISGCFYNRALAFVALGRFERAMADFDRALAVDPGCAEAALNRGLLHLRGNHVTSAVADFQYALDRGANPARAHFHLAQACLAQKDVVGALSHLEKCRQSEPDHAEAGELIKKLQNQR